MAPLHPELLIKIAIVNFSTPADAYGVAAHEPLDGGWIKRLDQKLHVLIELIIVAQVSRKAPDRKVRERVKPIEHNSEMLLQLAFVTGFELSLRRRQKRGYRLVNEMQRQIRHDSLA